MAGLAISVPGWFCQAARMDRCAARSARCGDRHFGRRRSRISASRPSRTPGRLCVLRISYQVVIQQGRRHRLIRRDDPACRLPVAHRRQLPAGAERQPAFWNWRDEGHLYGRSKRVLKLGRADVAGARPQRIEPARGTHHSARRSVAAAARPASARQACASFAKIGLSFCAVSGSSSGSTRVSPTTLMKFVSPDHRGTTCMCT